MEEIAKALGIDLDDPEERMYVEVHRKYHDMRRKHEELILLHRSCIPASYKERICGSCKQLWPCDTWKIIVGDEK